jgi:hypothetical protein
MQDLMALIIGCVVFGFCLSAMVLHSLGLPRDAALATALTAATTAAAAFLAGSLTWLVSEGLWQHAVLAGIAYFTAACAGVITDPARRPLGVMVSMSGWLVLPLAGLVVIRAM